MKFAVKLACLLSRARATLDEANEKLWNILLSAAALKTQPYDLLRWSAAYFRCLSLDVLPPVKPRYEHENVFGCLTKGYLKVLLSQVSCSERNACRVGEDKDLDYQSCPLVFMRQRADGSTI